MKHFYLLLLIVSSFCFGQQAYYNGIDFNALTDAEIKTVLANKISSNITFLPYSSSDYDTWDALKEIDEDPNNSSNVLLFYSGASVPKDNTLGNGNTGQEDWNREHVFARSLASPSLETNNAGPGTDINNLRPCDPGINGDRGSLPFADGSGSYGAVSGGWYPGDEWKGDVARMIMYMYLRYDGDGSDIEETYCLPGNVGVGSSASTPDDMIDLFLDWNAEDKVSALEMQRNDVSETRQGNRNPFIDNPALATVIWGGPNAEDLWGNLLSQQTLSQFEFKMYPNPVNEDFVYFSSTQNLEVIIYNVLGKEILIKNLDKTNNSINISNLGKGIYLVKLKSAEGRITKKLIKQ